MALQSSSRTCTLRFTRRRINAPMPHTTERTHYLTTLTRHHTRSHTGLEHVERRLNHHHLLSHHSHLRCARTRARRTGLDHQHFDGSHAVAGHFWSSSEVRLPQLVGSLPATRGRAPRCQQAPPEEAPAALGQPRTPQFAQQGLDRIMPD